LFRGAVLTPEIDLLSVYALSNASHEMEKESWRNFLGVIAPLLLECSTEKVVLWSEESSHTFVDNLVLIAKKLSEELKGSSLSNPNRDGEEKKIDWTNWENPDLKSKFSEKDSIPSHLFILFSGEISHDLGLTREFGIAAFVEPAQSTKVHQLASQTMRNDSKSKSRAQAKLIGKWLERFSKIQHDDDFLKNVLQWKEWIEPYIHEEEHADQEPTTKAS
jgi:hypothetical protein